MTTAEKLTFLRFFRSTGILQIVISLLNLYSNTFFLWFNTIFHFSSVFFWRKIKISDYSNFLHKRHIEQDSCQLYSFRDVNLWIPYKHWGLGNQKKARCQVVRQKTLSSPSKYPKKTPKLSSFPTPVFWGTKKNGF